MGDTIITITIIITIISSITIIIISDRAGKHRQRETLVTVMLGPALSSLALSTPGICHLVIIISIQIPGCASNNVFIIITILPTRQQDSSNRASFTLDGLEVEAEYQLQLQARNSFGWGKVSHQFNFQTNMVESTPVEEVRKEFSLYQLSAANHPVLNQFLLLALFLCLLR